MRIFKRPGSKYYWFKLVYRGVRYQESTKQTNKQKAEDFASAFRLRLIEGELNVKRKKPGPTFTKAMEQFLAQIEEQHPDHPRTVSRYRDASKPLLAFFGNTTLNAITAEDVARYRSRRSKVKSKRTGRELKPGTINLEMTVLKAIFSRNRKIVFENPAQDIKALPVRNEQMRVLGFDEEDIYLSVAGPELRNLAIVMLDTGMRPEEVFRITPENVNFKEGYVYNPYGKTKAAKRRLNLTTRAAEALRDRFARSLVLNMQNVSSQHRSALRKTKLAHFRIYDLRHTFATRAVESGVDAVTLAAMLGHSSIKMVMRYAHPTAEHQAKAIKMLEEFTTARQIEQLEESKMIH